jgi:serine/threonine-protein kinase PknG
VALRSRVLAAVAVARPLALAAGCSGGTAPGAAAAARAGPTASIPAGPANGPQSLSETGSTLLFPVLRNWAAAYRQQHSNVTIATASTGSGKGIAEASAGQVDIGASDAYLSSGDLITNPAMVNIPLAVSAQQVNYNLPGLRPAAEIVAALPVPQVDAADPAAGYLATLSTLDPGQRTAVLAAAVAGDQGTPQDVAQSAETRLALARSQIVTGDLAGAGTVLADLAAEDPADWRIAWYQGLRELAGGNPAGARAAFDVVVGALPGELAAKLALGFAAEAAGDQAAADHYFRLVWTVDHAYIGAVFGLARTRLAAGDPAAAIAALAAVPDTSSNYLAAQVTAVRIQVSPRPGQAEVLPGDLGQAGARVDRLKLDAIQMEYLTAEVLRAALACAHAGGTLPGGAVPGRLLGCEFTERGLRLGLERSYRAQARLATDRYRRIELVEAANSVRPRTWV